MTRDEAFRRACGVLEASAIEDPALEAEVILRHTLNIDRASFYAERGADLTATQEAEYTARVNQRAGGMPGAYIIGNREFYGLQFFVDDSVLIPRPETELLVEKAIEIARGYEAPRIADIGTGSGAIAISLAIKLPHSTIIATDISRRALDTARRNCERHRTGDRVLLCQGELLEPVTHPVDIIVANLPYVRTADLPGVNTSGWEPRIALDGGDDGLDIIRRLCSQVCTRLKPGGSLLMEIGDGQRDAVVGILHDLFPSTATREVQITETPNLYGDLNYHSGGGQNPAGKGDCKLDSSLRWNDKPWFFSSEDGRKSTTSQMARVLNTQIDVFPDLAGIDRVVCMTLPHK